MPLSSETNEGVKTQDQEEVTKTPGSLTREEKLIQWTITVLVPLLITFIGFGVIILAFSQWKLY